MTPPAVAEPLVCLVALFILWLIGVGVAAWLESADGMLPYPVLAVIATAALYFLVRFVHWAWMTPIPFLPQ